MGSSEFYRRAFKNSPIGGYLLSPTPDIIVLDVNDAFLDRLDLKREEMIGRPLFDIFPHNPDDPEDSGIEALRHSILQAVETRQVQVLPAQRFPVRKKLPHGEVIFEERFWNAFNAPVLSDDGTVLCVYHATTEVTKEVRAEIAMRRSEERFRSLVKAMSQIVWTADSHGNLTGDSPTWRAFTGQSYEEWRGLGSINAIHPDDRSRAIQGWAEATRQGKFYEDEYRLRHYDGGYRWNAVRAVPVKTADGAIQEWVGTNIDIEDKKQAAEELRVANERMKLALEGAGEGVWEWNMQENTASYSLMFSAISGFSAQELGDDPENWFALMVPEDRIAARAALDDHLFGKTASFHFDYRIRGKNGGVKWLHCRGVVVDKSLDGRPVRITGMVRDITAKKEAENHIWNLANFDTLTGLPNRQMFKGALHQHVENARRSHAAVALLFIDLDGFKQINDVFGHDTGDALLIEAADRIRKSVGNTDTLARLGGDEFTVILADLHKIAKVERIAHAILAALTLPFQLGHERTFISGSIGIALYPNDANTPEELIRKADQAMYAAKHAGKNGYRYFTPEIDEKAHMRLRLIQGLRHAIELGQISVQYQPVVELKSGTIVKAEALARWTHPLFGEVSPERFIPLAEESGMINAIGDYVFREAASCIKHLSLVTGVSLQVSVNKSPVQFGSAKHDQWLEFLRQLNLSPHYVTVEITEGLLLDVSENVSTQLYEYRDAGIQVAIDDFGTGYSSLAYLQKFHIDYLKIDKSFVSGLPANQGDRAIAESIVAMAHKLGLKVIAEGVETREQLEVLKEAGCDYGQGYYFSGPLQASDFELFLQKRQRAVIT